MIWEDLKRLIRKYSKFILLQKDAPEFIVLNHVNPIIL